MKNLNKIQEKIYSKFRIKAKAGEKQRMWLKINRGQLLGLLQFLKEHGFEHLSSLSALDWPDQEKLELVYHLWNYQDKLLLSIKTTIERKTPSIESAASIWANAQIQEREIHELFGINFLGNPDLSELFLENWQGPPPFLKDFDWQKYVKEKYYSEGREEEKGYYK